MKKLFIYLLIFNITSLAAQDINMQNGSFIQCSGVFYDSGGEFANYGNDENFVVTICPENPGQLIQLEFITFATQLNTDLMVIYNGDSTAATPFGTFSGVANPGFVTATSDNGSGCLTIEFTSNGSGNTTGWEANISCLTPCQTITSQLDSASPTPNADNYIRVCPNEEITLTGSGNFSVDGTGASYEWDLGDGNTVAGQTATFSYATPGVYIVNLNIRDANTSVNPEGCPNTNLINQVVQVATEPDFTGTQAAQTTLCFGDSTVISGVVNPVEFINDCTAPISGVTPLPDGGGAVYETSITVDCYDSSQTVTDVNQILGVCLNMEHSYSGDLDIFIISPNGQQAQLFDQAGGGTYWGGADNNDNGIPGVGADYCFSMSATIPLSAAPTIIAGSNPPNNSWAPGTYLPVQSFNSLLGSPLNGDWTIRIVDNLFIDDGTIFSWSIDFDPNLQPPEYSFTPVITSEAWDADPTIIATSGNDITVQPNAQGLFTYTYRVTDDFGCEYTQDVVIEMLPEIVTANPNDLFVCDTGAPPYLFDLASNTPIVLANATNQADLVVTYHESQSDADSDLNAITGTNSYSGTDAQVIYIRVEYLNSGCYELLPFSLTVSGQPLINAAPDLAVCDDASNDGVESFNLAVQTPIILGAQPAAQFLVTYYTNFADADTGTNALPVNYSNTINPEPIYVRIESVGNSACYNASVNPVFNLIVNPLAEANQPGDLELCDDLSNDGFETFDLSLTESQILGTQDPLVYDVTYYESQADADNAVNPIGPLFTNSTPSSQIIYVRVEDSTIPQCYATTSFNIVVNALPSVIIPTPLQVCDDDTDGFTAFNLSDKTNEILNGQTGLTVTYHENSVDANAANNQINDGYTNTMANLQTIFVRLENDTTSCYNITTLDLEVIANPVANPLTPLEVCDDNNNGFAIFDLSQKNAEVTGAQINVTVSYHISQADANMGSNDLPILYTNTVANSQTIFVRVEDNNTACFDTTTLQLIVNPLPTVVAVTDYELCDINNTGDEIEIFDLTTKDAEVLNGQANVSLAYFETQLDAEANINPIVGPYNNTSNPQVIFAALENNSTNCRTVLSFNLVINELPSLIPPTPLEVCDDGVADGFTAIDLTIKNTEISGGNANYGVTYYLTQGDAEAEVNALPSTYTNISNPQTVYVRVEDNSTACYSTTTLDLVVEQAPEAFVPSPLEYCDPDNDGFGLFTLSDADNQITGGAAGVSVSYHETLVNAQTNVNAIDTTVDYGNIVANTQTLYARVESATIATDCFTIVALQLNVLSTPVVPSTLSDYVLCDTNADGITQFNLNTKNAEILGSQSATDYTLTYHLNATDAASGNNPIVNVGNYSNTSNPQTIYVRLQSNANGCDTLGNFDLQVDLPPVAIVPTPLEVCDDLGEVPGDEITVFDLTTKDTEITGGNASWSVSYYQTSAEAQSDTNAIADATQYTNTSVGGAPANPQTLYVRVTDTDTGCIDLTTLTIRVLPNPTPTTVLPELILCDDTNAGDGVEAFDLTTNEVLLLNGEAGVTATYHESLEDSDSGQNAIANPTQYINTVSPQQTIYVRVTNNTTACYALVDFDIRVDPLPSAVAVTNYIICELNTDGFFAFDLTEKDDEVLGGQDASLFTVTYHESQADADAQTNALISPYTNISNPQEIYVAITNNTTGCSVSTQRFNIEVQEAAEANSDMMPIVYELCDDNLETDGNPSNDSVQFDLSTQDTEVLDGQDPANYTVSYYATEIDATLNVNALPLLYENLFNNQVIYARVDNNATSCFAVAPLTLQVNPLPEISIEAQYVLCIDTNGSEVVGLPVIDTNLSETLYSFEWSYNGTILAGEMGSSLTPTVPGVYMVEVTDTSTSTVTSCSNTASTEVIESGPPSVVATVVTQAFADNHTIEAIATGIGVYEYSLDGGPWQESGVFTNVSSGIHEITARDRRGCGLASDEVLVMDYPLYFTPNGDGNHDTWKISGIDTQPSAKIYIFDRYGKLLKELNPTGEGWNGTYGGALMPSSDYWFTVVYTEPSTGEQKELTAHFTLKR